MIDGKKNGLEEKFYKEEREAGVVCVKRNCSKNKCRVIIIRWEEVYLNLQIQYLVLEMAASYH